MNEFIINEFITLKLEENHTIIYIKGERFTQCKYLFINFPVNEITTLNDIESIDEAAQRLDNTLEAQDQFEKIISPDQEFWGHCSNLQVWAENHYDTRLIHSNLAFPLLKKLAEVGEVRAKTVFKEEIARRIESGYTSVVLYLLYERYLDFLTQEEIEAIEIDPNRGKTILDLINIGTSWYSIGYQYEREGTPNKALQCFKKAFQFFQSATQKDPNNSRVWNLLGNVYYFLGDHDKENECYERSIEIDPYYFDPWYNKACIECIRDNIEDCLKYLTKAISLNDQLKIRAKLDPDLNKIKAMDEFKILTK
jgi:tetratricopeptide (TPR) repeat protein